MSETVEVTGTVERIGDLQTFDSGFTKREVVVNTGGQYPDQIGVEFLKDNTAKVDELNVGDSIIVTGFLGGRDVECRDGTTRELSVDQGDTRAVRPGRTVCCRTGPGRARSTVGGRF